MDKCEQLKRALINEFQRARDASSTHRFDTKGSDTMLINEAAGRYSALNDIILPALKKINPEKKHWDKRFVLSTLWDMLREQNNEERKETRYCRSLARYYARYFDKLAGYEPRLNVNYLHFYYRDFAKYSAIKDVSKRIKELAKELC